jgi:TorA maturation chaperone TorD
MSDDARREVATIAELTAALYLKAPSEELLAELKEFFPAGKGPGTEPLELLRREYFELFFNPATEHFLCPFESFARERRYWGECAVEVGEFYRQSGFDPGTLLSDVHWKNQRMPDHLGFELAFFSALLRSAEAQPDEAKALLATAQYFHAAHIRSWAGDFGDRLESRARTSLYRLLGGLTREVAAWIPGSSG